MDLREQMILEHQNLETVLGAMQAAVQRDDPRALCEAWSRFERDLGDHLRFEERELLPPFAAFDRVEAQGLREEHDRIRHLVADLGISADLHTMRAAVADQLLAALQSHGRREDGKLYRWAREHLPEETRQRLDGERVRQQVATTMDELRLKLHLLGMETRDDLAELQREMDKLAHETVRRSELSGLARLAASRVDLRVPGSSS